MPAGSGGGRKPGPGVVTRDRQLARVWKRKAKPSAEAVRGRLVSVEASAADDGMIVRDETVRYRRLRTLNVVVGLLLAAECRDVGDA